jgi:hypothetical protein
MAMLTNGSPSGSAKLLNACGHRPMRWLRHRPRRGGGGGHGASREEIDEALGVATAANASAALVYSTRVPGRAGDLCVMMHRRWAMGRSHCIDRRDTSRTS